VRTLHALAFCLVVTTASAATDNTGAAAFSKLRALAGEARDFLGLPARLRFAQAVPLHLRGPVASDPCEHFGLVFCLS
jgi:hypothetical protein